MNNTVNGNLYRINFKVFTLKLILLITSFITGCSIETDREIPVISVSSLINDALTLEDISTEIQYIKLDQQQPIRQILNIENISSQFFIATTDGLFLFNSSGQYLREIGKKGKGPGKYNTIYDITVDCESNLIYLLGYKKVFVYDFNGQFKYSFPTVEEIWFERILYKNSKLYFLSGFDFGHLKYNWVVTDLKGNKLLVKENSIGRFKSGVSYKTNLSFTIDEKIFYWNNLNDTIFQINDNNGSPKLLFGNDKYRVTKRDLADLDSYRNKTSWQLITVLGCDRFLVLEYVLTKELKRIYTLFDKKRNTFYQLNITDLENELGVSNSFDSGICFMPKTKIHYKSEDWFVQWIDAYKLKAHVASETFKNSTPKCPEKKKELEKLANSLDENDNPVLMLVKLKN
jgi:hypothetical protein